MPLFFDSGTMGGEHMKTQKKHGKADSGFTLIELMIVVAIIGILAAVAIPKFADLIRKSSEGATKGSLGAIRSAVSIYYGDLEGTYPTTLEQLTAAGKYLATMPKAKTPPFHTDTAGTINPAAPFTPTDVGGWMFANVVTDANYGTVWVNCSHTDTKNAQWTSY